MRNTTFILSLFYQQSQPLPITHTTKFFRYFPIKKKRIYIFARRKIIINKSWTTITRITTFEADRKQTS